MTQQEMMPYAEDPFMAEALAYVYIGQFVRLDGPARAGVLAGDCQRYYGQIKELLSKGDIREANWVQLNGYVTTAQGKEKAQSILNNKVKTNVSRLDSELSLVPQRLLQYLFQDVFLSDKLGLSDEGRRVEVTKDVGRWDNTPTFSNDRPTYFCLLANRDILSYRDHLCQLLVSLGLMVTAHPYVSTDGGRADNETYVPARELQAYLDEYRLNTGLAGYWCPQELEEMHTVFHELHREKIILIHDRLDLTWSIPVRYRESVNEFINECLAKNQITETSEPRKPHFRINDIYWYDNEETKRYQKPLIDFLLGQSVTPPPLPMLGVSLAVIPVEVSIGTEVTAKVHVRDNQDNPVQGAEVAVLWGDGESKGFSDDNGAYSTGHIYSNAGSFTVAIMASKDSFLTGKVNKQIKVSQPGGGGHAPSVPIKVGNLLDHGQHGLLGRVDNRDVVLDLYEPHAITVLGVQGSGKSYAAGAIIEMAVRAIPGISTLTKPLSCIIFHFSKEEARVPEWIGLASANSSQLQGERLKIEYGVIPDSVPRTNINVLVPPTKVSDRQKQYPGFNVMPLVFSPSKLKADDWRRLLTFGKGSDSLYMEALKDLMIDLRDKKANFDADDLKDEITKSDLSPNQNKFALQRIKTIGRWLSQDGQPFVDLLKPGVVNIVDLRDPLAVDAGMASLVLQTVFSFIKDRPPEGICLVAIDEAHLFFEHEQLTKDIVEFVALLRKDYKVYLLLMSQQPGRFHPDILALSDVIICYRLESDTELDFLKKNKPAFADVTKDIKKLRTGEGKAFLWARVSTDDEMEKPRLISVRPKVTEDRGKTATAF